MPDLLLPDPDLFGLTEVTPKVAFCAADVWDAT
jgi:hypothetical protein